MTIRAGVLLLAPGVLVGILCVQRSGVLAATNSTAAADTCVRQIGDVTGDQIPDLVVSRQDPSTGSLRASLVAGPHDPSSLLDDTPYLRRHLISTLRGPAARPFECGTPLATLPLRAASATASKQTTPVASDPPVRYEIVDLNSLSPGGDLVANRVNNDGHVVGHFLTADGYDHAFVIADHQLQDLGTLGGSESDARGINRHGDVVGYSLTGAADDFGLVNAAFLFTGSAVQRAAPDWSAASDVNRSGQIVGEMRFTPGLDLLHAFLNDRGAFTDLGSLPPIGAAGAYSTAHAINDRGWIVGESNTYTNGVQSRDQKFAATRAFFWAGAMRDLGSLGKQCNAISGVEHCFERSVATDINRAGTLVGFSSTATATAHAFMTNGGPLVDLGAMDGDGSYAYGINDSGQIVGAFSDANGRMSPFLYDQGAMYPLNDLVTQPLDAGSMPFAAYDINNFGQIIGNHHLLQPLYDVAAPHHPYKATLTVRRTFAFDYWIARGAPGECRAFASRIRIEVKVGGGEWTTSAASSTCGDSTDWGTASVQTKRGDGATRVRVRVREDGPSTAPTVYLRRVRTT